MLRGSLGMAGGVGSAMTAAGIGGVAATSIAPVTSAGTLGLAAGTRISHDMEGNKLGGIYRARPCTRAPSLRVSLHRCRSDCRRTLRWQSDRCVSLHGHRVRLGVAGRPGDAPLSKLYGVSLVAGIGFTVALFIASLTFADTPAFLDQAKIGILVGSARAESWGARSCAPPGPALDEVSPARRLR